jgi:hypothetical protein
MLTCATSGSGQCACIVLLPNPQTVRCHLSFAGDHAARQPAQHLTAANAPAMSFFSTLKLYCCHLPCLQEITRRVNLRNIWQAAYTAGVVLPKPVCGCRYWHRSLNPKKLIEVKFSSLQVSCLQLLYGFVDKLEL